MSTASFVLVVHLRIKPQYIERFTTLVQENAAAARAEPGCRQFDIVADPKDATRLMLYEVYDDERAFEAHQAGPDFKRYLEVAVPLLEARERTVWTRIAG